MLLFLLQPRAQARWKTCLQTGSSITSLASQFRSMLVSWDFPKKKIPYIHRENAGSPLGLGPPNNQPHIHLIFRGYLLGIYPFKGLQQEG